MDKSPNCRSQDTGFESRRGNYVLWQDVNLHLPLSTQVLNGYLVGCDSSWFDKQVCACEMAPGRNTPQGVENVHTLCADQSESDDRDNNISVTRLDTSLMY